MNSGTATYAGFRTRTLSVEGSGPRFVLLHGYTDSANTWDGVLREVEASGRSAIAVDLPGFGLADPLLAGPVVPQIDNFVTELVAEQSQRGPVILVGNSLGGSVSVRAAARGVPLAGVVTIGDPAAGPWRLRSFAGSPRTGLLMRLVAMVPVPTILIRLFVWVGIRRILYGNPRGADPAVLERFMTWLVALGGSRALVRQVRLVCEDLANGHGAIEVECPTLIVHGVKDRIVPVRGSRALHASLPGSELHIEPRWGHCPQLDDPAAMTRLLVERADAWLADSAEAGLA